MKKIDRGALPVPNLAFRDKVSDAHKGSPRNEIEKQIANGMEKRFWELLKLCITENFFDLGGHSLLLAQVHAKLPLFCKINKIVDLFRYPTIQALAHYLEKDTEEDNIFIQPDNHADRLRL